MEAGNVPGRSVVPYESSSDQQFDVVITVCDHAAETCPTFPGRYERVHWSFPDPAAAAGTDEERRRAFMNTGMELRARIRAWLRDRHRVV
jgi:arsenate reductase